MSEDILYEICILKEGEELTYDWDVCEKLSLDELDALAREVCMTLWHVDHLKAKLGEWGFDMRSPLESDSFMVQKLTQYSADLRYVNDELCELIKKKGGEKDIDHHGGMRE